MGSSSGAGNQLDPSLRTVRGLNLAFASLGFIQLAFNVLGYSGIPASFIDEYGPFMKVRFPVTCATTGLLLGAMAYAGIRLSRRDRSSINLCRGVFVAEILFFAIFFWSWSLPFSPLRPVSIAAGLMNGALAVQLVTAYPVVGLVLLARSQRRESNRSPMSFDGPPAGL